MWYLNVEQWTVNEVAANIAGAKDVLYAQGISATDHLNLANAAAAASVSIDELLAVLHYRMHHAATPARAEERRELEEFEVFA